jgi:hypothetical protein
MRVARVGGLVFALVALQGCAALPLAVVGGSIASAGAGAVVKTGTEYTLTGAAHRTFTVPINAVRAGVLEAFERTGVEVTTSDAAPNEADHRITGTLQHRTLQVRLRALSPSLTAMTLSVKRNFFVRDRATSSELLEQIEQVLAENPTFARRLHRSPETERAASRK